MYFCLVQDETGTKKIPGPKKRPIYGSIKAFHKLPKLSCLDLILIKSTQHISAPQKKKLPAKYCTRCDVFLKTCRDMLKELDLRHINRFLLAAKVKGVDVVRIFQLLFVFQYFDIKNTHQYIRKGSPSLQISRRMCFTISTLSSYHNILLR